MIHAQQKGYSTDQILRGLCDAVARNFKSAIVKGRHVIPPVAFIGGVSQNQAVGTTGSGRELIGELIGADTVNDEITAHKTGAMHVSNMLGMEPVEFSTPTSMPCRSPSPRTSSVAKNLRWTKSSNSHAHTSQLLAL
jgi:hypothetical protein